MTQERKCFKLSGDGGKVCLLSVPEVEFKNIKVENLFCFCCFALKPIFFHLGVFLFFNN